MKIVKLNGYVYSVEGYGGFETYHTLGKDPDDPRWHEDEKEIEIIEKEDDIIEIKEKVNKKKKSRD